MEMHNWPQAINILVKHQPYRGAVPLGIDVLSRIQYSAVAMAQVWYTSPHRIRGVWCSQRNYKSPNTGVETETWFFLGYRCTECQQVSLVPDTVKDCEELHQAMHHECMDK